MNCENYRQKIMDLAYGEGIEDSELTGHLTSCPECAAYYAKLLRTQALLGEMVLPEESGFRDVRRAVTRARALVEKRLLFLDLLKFAGVIICIFLLHYLIYRWQGVKGVAGAYIATYLIIPFLSIPLSKPRRLKEEGR